MTPREMERLTLVYALGGAIEQRDWVTAEALRERLLLLCTPLAPLPATDVRPTLTPHQSTLLMH